MARFRLAPSAQRDIEGILAWTDGQFGQEVRLRYEALLVQAFLDLAHDPGRAGAVERHDLAKGAFTYHLRYSRDHVSRSMDRIRKPRHFLLYRLMPDGFVEVGRVLHDSMDLARYVPADYQVDDETND